MKTVREFIEENNLKPGDKVTDGTNTWRIQRYMDRMARDKYEFYLKGDTNATPLVAGSSLHVVVIPNLRKVPQRINVYKWAYQCVGEAAKVTEHSYPTEEALRKRFTPEEDILWIQRLDNCMTTIEADCPC